MEKYNTPRGELRTALDKFVYEYTSKGYDYEIIPYGIIFTKGNETIKAEATFNKKGWINGYKVA